MADGYGDAVIDALIVTTDLEQVYTNGRAFFDESGPEWLLNGEEWAIEGSVGLSVMGWS